MMSFIQYLLKIFSCVEMFLPKVKSLGKCRQGLQLTLIFQPQPEVIGDILQYPLMSCSLPFFLVNYSLLYLHLKFSLSFDHRQWTGNPSCRWERNSRKQWGNWSLHCQDLAWRQCRADGEADRG